MRSTAWGWAAVVALGGCRLGGHLEGLGGGAGGAPASVQEGAPGGAGSARDSGDEGSAPGAASAGAAGAPALAEARPCPGAPTQAVRLRANLDGREPVLAIPWDTNAPIETSNVGVTLTVADELGELHPLELFFRKVAPDTWDYFALARGAELAVPGPHERVEVGSGRLAFRGGMLESLTVQHPVHVRFANDTVAQVIALDLGAPRSLGGSGKNAISQWDAHSAVFVRAANGCAATLARTCSSACQALAQPVTGPATFDFALWRGLFSVPPGRPLELCAPEPTTTVQVVANLDAGATIPSVPWDQDQACNTSNFQTSITVYDALGGAHSIELYFRKVDTSAYEYHVIVYLGDARDPRLGGRVESGSGVLQFTPGGVLESHAVTAPVSANFPGTATQEIALELGRPTAAGGTGLDGVTALSAPSNVSRQDADGTPRYYDLACPAAAAPP